jgi:hypothetical protein
MNNARPYANQGMAYQQTKPKRRLWLWGLGGCGLLACAGLGVLAFFLFILPADDSEPLVGNVSFPATVRKGDHFDLAVTLTNPTAEPIFIKHVVLHNFLTTPSFFDGASLLGVEPNMPAESLEVRDDVQFPYFQQIKPGETITVVFHMRAENAGTFYEDVAVYARDPVRPEPAFIYAFHYAPAQIEVTP